MPYICLTFDGLLLEIDRSINLNMRSFPREIDTIITSCHDWFFLWNAQNRDGLNLLAPPHMAFFTLTSNDPLNMKDWFNLTRKDRANSLVIRTWCQTPSNAMDIWTTTRPMGNILITMWFCHSLKNDDISVTNLYKNRGIPSFKLENFKIKNEDYSVYPLTIYFLLLMKSILSILNTNKHYKLLSSFLDNHINLLL